MRWWRMGEEEEEEEEVVVVVVIVVVAGMWWYYYYCRAHRGLARVEECWPGACLCLARDSDETCARATHAQALCCSKS